MKLSSGQQRQVIEHTQLVVAQGSEVFKKQVPEVSVLFDLKGRAAGQFRVRNRVCEIRYNPDLFALYFEDNLANTVPHEVAHYLVYMMYSRRRLGARRIKPHGLEWRQLMAALGADSQVCHNYETADIPQRREQRFRYRCACKQHQISCRRHNKIQAGRARYHCRYCNNELSAVE